MKNKGRNKGQDTLAESYKIDKRGLETTQVQIMRNATNSLVKTKRDRYTKMFFRVTNKPVTL